MNFPSQNVNDRMIERLDAAIDDICIGRRPSDRYGKDDLAVFSYIRSQLTENGLALRGEDHQNVSHLHEAAKIRLRPYEEARNAKQPRT